VSEPISIIAAFLESLMEIMDDRFKVITLLLHHPDIILKLTDFTLLPHEVLRHLMSADKQG
jgi:hypothetical protein